MVDCRECNKRSVCKEICKAVEELLPKPLSGKYGRKERTVDPQTLEGLAGDMAFKLKYGRRKKPVHYGDKLEG